MSFLYFSFWRFITAWSKAAIVCIILTNLNILAADIGADDRRPFGKDFDTGMSPDAEQYLRMSPTERLAEFSTETKEIRIAQQYGLGYLPLMIVRQHGLIEKHANMAALGSVKVVWKRFPSGKVMNDALQIGLLDFASGGVAPMLESWDKSYGDFGIKGVAALAAMPMYLNTVNPAIRRIEDFSSQDRIALPAVGVSGQAIVLQMQAAKVFGKNNYKKLDKVTVSMSHPAALKALLSKKISAHMASPPYQYQELEDHQVHTVFSSYQVLGGPATFSAVWTRGEFSLENPKTTLAVYHAIREAMQLIRTNKRKAAEIYVLQANSSLPLAFIQKILNDPLVEFSIVPLNIMKFAKFMHQTASINNLPENWRDVFFPMVHGEQGS